MQVGFSVVGYLGLRVNHETFHTDLRCRDCCPPLQEATAAWPSKPSGFGEVGEGREGMFGGCAPTRRPKPMGGVPKP